MSDPIYQDATMAQVRAVDGTFISYPFLEDGDTTTKVYNMVCTQTATDYNAAQVALDTPMSSAAAAGVIALPFPADSAAYFVGDTGHTPVGGGMISFTRTFANIPKSITIPSGSEQFSFPGYGPNPAGGQFELSDYPYGEVDSMSMIYGVEGVFLNGRNFFIGDPIFKETRFLSLSLSYTVDNDPFVHQYTGLARMLQESGTIRVDIGKSWNKQVFFTVLQGSYGHLFNNRPPQNLNVFTTTSYDYILPGVHPTIATAQDITIPPKFAVYSSARSQFILSENTVDDEAVIIDPAPGIIPATMPSETDYFKMIDDGANLVIESSVNKWAGNIHVRKIKTCKAQ